MTNEELQQQIEQLEQQIKDLKVKLESKAEPIPYRPYKVEVPDDLEDYYFLNETGNVMYKTLYSSNYQKKTFIHGLAFKTKEEAEQHDKERILLFKLHKWAEKHNGGWTPNWKDLNETKYFIIYDKLYEIFKIDCYGRIKPFSKLPYFKSEELAEQFIEEFGDEIKEVLC